MKVLSQIWFPAAAIAITAATMGISHPSETSSSVLSFASDTVIYKKDAYKTAGARVAMISDSLLKLGSTGLDKPTEYIDPRDTTVIPDSLRDTDPFRYKYYVALRDSLIHVLVRDSLIAAGDNDDYIRLDSIYAVDSAAAALERYNLWYASLSKEERKKILFERKMVLQKARADSLNNLKENRKAVRDSIIEETPRILTTFAVPDSMQYKRIIQWTVDQDFQKFDISSPDTLYTTHLDDYPFRKQDVNASWLGVSGSPVQQYNYHKRQKNAYGVEYFDALESWTFDVNTVRHFNTKTPYTELAYYGTLLAGTEKESDNLHLFTTQNILPSFNLSLLFDRWGGGGFLANQETKNKTSVVNVNYLGKKYMAHAGFIRNKVDAGENGGITDISIIEKNRVDARSVSVANTTAKSKALKNTVYLDQQLRIPFEFINKIKARKDSSFVEADSILNRDITTAFIGHSTQYSAYSRNYIHKDTLALSNKVLDNKFFIKLQPWSEDGFVSKLNIGIGDLLQWYPGTKENTIYLYGGIEGRIKKTFDWGANTRFDFAGAHKGDFLLNGHINFNFFPFADQSSPLHLGANFDMSVKDPTYYQKHFSYNGMQWDNDFAKTTKTSVRGLLNIPYWKLNADVGYTLLKNGIYYDKEGKVAQYSDAVSILSASIRKEFVIGSFLHLDNKVLIQTSGNQEVVPVPTAAFNLKYYAQFVVQRDPSKTKTILEMQFGINAFYNTLWNAPAWNPVTGTFYNQTERRYNNGPVFDVFINAQWKRACIFIKVENIGDGWPMKSKDYFSADRFILPQRLLPSLKLGIYWPFYIQPEKHEHVHID